MHINIGGLLAKRAQLSPKLEGLYDVANNLRLSYAQFNARVDQTANMISALGLKKGDRVALLLMNSIEFAESFLACAKLGLVVVPLNWRLVPDELEFILKDSGSTVLIFGGEFTANVDELYARGPKTDISKWLYVGPDGNCPKYARSFSELTKAAPATPVNITAGEDDTLYIMYTSGTTGLPKGVVHTHNTSFWAIATLSATADMRLYDRFLLTLPMFHVGALLPLMVCIYNGLSCVMQRAFDPAITWKLIEGEKINVAMLVPAMVNFMLQVPEIETVDASSLRFFLCGAAPVPDHLVLSYDKRNIPVLQIYGLTETCGPVAVVSLDDYRDKVGSTGKAFMHTDVRIINVETGQDMPVDVPGELITRSKHNMIAYWNREKATLETLRDGWLYTGDIARMDADGYVFIADRSKDMIISGGENVYPAEVEGVLLTHPKIREVAVIGQASAKWGESPLAVVVKADPSLTEAEVLGYANGKLSRFKLPKAVVFIDEIPRNPSGKVLKRVLREQFPDDAPE
jgi:acyl-CoA synthetase (AMP-forming)/AMP-acid ligase II